MSVDHFFLTNRLPSLALGVSLFVSACGGASPQQEITPSPVVETPSLSVVAGAPRGGSFSLTVGSGPSSAVTGYCIKSSAIKPASNDACFQIANTKTVALTLPNTSYYVWTKNAAGVVTAQGSSRGPCSASGYLASDTAFEKSGLPTVCVSTSAGEFVLELESQKAPITTANFLKYVNDGFYTDMIFHRVVPNFTVNSGKWTKSLTEKTPTYDPIALEPFSQTNISHLKGTIAMLRPTGGTSTATATTQFFVNLAYNATWHTAFGGMAAFGNVIAGMDSTLTPIGILPTTASAIDPLAPTDPPVIQWAYQLR